MLQPTGNVISLVEYLAQKEEGIMKGIGLCAVGTRQGDWAFDYAFSLAKHHKTKLNIFHFLESPYAFHRDFVFVDGEKTKTARVTPDLIAQKDKEMREMFDERLGDYLEVGFRLCEGNDEWELRKCFRKGQYDVLVVGYIEKGASFGGTTTIEEFASRFKGPVVLIGPDDMNSFYINDNARKILSKLLIPDGQWKLIDKK
jgi:hypothetical protein